MSEVRGKLGELDYSLILEIQESPRRSYRKLAERLNVSESTVRRRLNALLESGTVSISAVPDPFKLGYQVVAFIGLHVHPSDIDAIAKRLVSLPNIHYVSLCSGDVEFMIWGYFANTGKLADFIANELGQIPGIVKAETMIQLRSLKRSLGVSKIDMTNAGLDSLQKDLGKSRNRTEQVTAPPVRASKDDTFDKVSTASKRRRRGSKRAASPLAPTSARAGKRRRARTVSPKK